MRYARALLAFAKSRGTEDRVYDETKRLARVSVTVPQLRHTIDNPVLSMDAKHKLLCDAVGVENVSEELKRFFRLVLEEKREKFLQFMIWSYIDLYRAQAGRDAGRNRRARSCRFRRSSRPAGRIPVRNAARRNSNRSAGRFRAVRVPSIPGPVSRRSRV